MELPVEFKGQQGTLVRGEVSLGRDSGIHMGAQVHREESAQAETFAAFAFITPRLVFTSFLIGGTGVFPSKAK